MNSPARSSAASAAAAQDANGSQPRILMCPPDYYGVEYEINPWMSRQKQPDHAMAILQWTVLRDLLLEVGARVELLEPVRGLPDLVFTANAAMIFRDQSVLARFRFPQRQGEESVDAAWLERAGYAVRQLAEGVFFEGAGDALFCGDTLFAGYRIRSDIRGHQEIGQMFSCRVIPLELVDPYYYHLDTCFCPLAPGVAIYYPPAFDDYGRRALEEAVSELIPVSENEARRFACNAVVVGRFVVTNTGCNMLQAQLRERGYEPRPTPLDEFVKAGGSAKCLTLRLDGEDAAAWKYTPAR
ncbi:MAG TPA: arginine deiminase-related protein [Pirellulales bacterium]|jgi:N-dimethylarginine dimethylaminohydrolase|nr:arginine deiminase-related protein [Pirellulales bacterium]